MLARFLSTPKKFFTAVTDGLGFTSPGSSVPKTPFYTTPSSTIDQPKSSGGISSVASIAARLSGGSSTPSPRHKDSDGFARLIVGQGLEIVDLDGNKHIFQPESGLINYYFEILGPKIFVDSFKAGVADVANSVVPVICKILMIIK